MSSEKQTSRVFTPGFSTCKRVPHHRGARHLAERADMRQARRAVARLEQHLARRVRLLQPFQKLARLFEGPSLGGLQRALRAMCAAAVMIRAVFVMWVEELRGLCGGGGARVNPGLTHGRIDYGCRHAVPALLLGLARGVARIAGRFLLGRERCLPFGFFRGFKLGLGAFLAFSSASRAFSSSFFASRSAARASRALAASSLAAFRASSRRIILRLAFREFLQRRFLGLRRRLEPLVKIDFKSSHSLPFSVSRPIAAALTSG